MNCTHCGAPLSPNQRFCTKCGHAVAGTFSDSTVQVLPEDPTLNQQEEPWIHPMNNQSRTAGRSQNVGGPGPLPGLNRGFSAGPNPAQNSTPNGVPSGFYSRGSINGPQRQAASPFYTQKASGPGYPSSNGYSTGGMPGGPKKDPKKKQILIAAISSVAVIALCGGIFAGMMHHSSSSNNKTADAAGTSQSGNTVLTPPEKIRDKQTSQAASEEAAKAEQKAKEQKAARDSEKLKEAEAAKKAADKRAAQEATKAKQAEDKAKKASEEAKKAKAKADSEAAARKKAEEAAKKAQADKDKNKETKDKEPVITPSPTPEEPAQEPVERPNELGQDKPIDIGGGYQVEPAPESFTWQDAKVEAQAAGGTLAVFMTGSELDEVQSYLDSSYGTSDIFVIGAYKPAGGEEAYWVEGTGLMDQPVFTVSPDLAGRLADGEPDTETVTVDMTGYYVLRKTDAGWRIALVGEDTRPGYSGYTFHYLIK